jgi:hypothetical protein
VPGAPGPASADSGAQGLIPPGYGSLRQDDIALRLDVPGIIVKAFPLDESVIRVLAPDSYRAMHDLLESERVRIAASAARSAISGYSVWYVSYFGVEPDARFTPSDVIISAAGREYRPADIIPVTAGFGEQRIAQRQTQAALYLFDQHLDTNQPLDVSVGTVRTSQWAAVLRVVERERALIRSRARPPPVRLPPQVRPER